MSRTVFRLQALTTPNTKVLPIPSSDCFRSALLVVSVRRNRVTSSHPRELSVRRCLNDAHSEHASSGTSTRAEIKAGASCPPPERLCLGGCRTSPASELSEISHARVGTAVSRCTRAHVNSELECLGGGTD